MKLNKTYWADRYQEQQTDWDIGYPSTPLVNYINQIQQKDLKILIPGAGNAYEAEYLYKNGFKNVFVLDIAEEPLLNFEKRVPEFPINHLINEDFFNLEMQFDLILEQTFFCALPLNKRTNYVTQAYHSLYPKGKLAGLLFNFPLNNESGPPFGGSKKEYIALFEKHFKIKTLEPCINSIKPRQGNELFFIFEKK
ncbi:methyltransferase domain-containing protein [Zhouia sp. PK063]|uniref:methyltransferase domain-containing protein n=1 Tax=Zhouia sp. PK063 TaxID=3373602 RepID=UPI0037B8526B